MFDVAFSLALLFDWLRRWLLPLKKCSVASLSVGFAVKRARQPTGQPSQPYKQLPSSWWCVGVCRIRLFEAPVMPAAFAHSLSTYTTHSAPRQCIPTASARGLSRGRGCRAQGSRRRRSASIAAATQGSIVSVTHKYAQQ